MNPDTSTAPLAAEPAAGSTSLAKGIAALLFLTYVWGLPPWSPGVVIYFGADSWREVLCHFAGSGLQAGVDLVYTAGPLGFLRPPVYCAQTQWIAIAWFVLKGLSLAALYFRIFGPAPRWVAVVSGSVFLLLPLIDGARGTGLYFALLALYLFLEAERPRRRLHWSDAVLALTMAVGSWIVFTRFVAAVAAVGAGAWLYFLRFRRPSPFAGLYLLFLGVVWTLAHQRPSSLWPYLQNSLDLSRGYAEAMSGDGPIWELWLALAVFGVVCGAFWTFRRLWGPWLVWASLGLGFTGIFWLAFKTSFVRHSRPRATTAALVLVAIALCVLASWARARRMQGRRSAAVAGIALVLALTTTLLFMGPSVGLGAIHRIQKLPVRWQQTILGIEDHLRGFPDLEARDEARAERVRQRLALPAMEGPVDLFGWDAGYMIALGLDYRPRPVFQNYVAFTPRLAELNARFYQSEAAPPTVLMDLKRLSGFPMTLMDAQSFLELLASYEAKETYGSVLRLERKERQPCRLEPVFSASRKLGRRIEFDGLARATPLWVEVDIRPTLFGRAMALLFKPDRLAMRVEMDTGAFETYRLSSVAARGGFLLSPLLRRNGDYKRLSTKGLKGAIRLRIVRAIRIMAPGEWASAQFHQVHVRAYAVQDCIPDPAHE